MLRQQAVAIPADRTSTAGLPLVRSVIFTIWAVGSGFTMVPYLLADRPLPASVLVLVVGSAVLCIMAVSVLSSFAKGAYYTCLYLWTIEVERAGDPALARVPAPLRASLA